MKGKRSSFDQNSAAFCQWHGSRATVDNRPPRLDVVREVRFDLGGVLYDDSAWRRWLFQLLGRMGLHTHYRSFFRVWDCDFQPHVWNRRCEFWPAIQRFLVEAGLTRGQAAEVEAGCRARFREFESSVRPFPSVANTLRHLSASGRSVVIISQAPLTADEIRAQLARLQLLELVSRVQSPQPAIRGRDGIRESSRFRPCGPGAGIYVGRDPNLLGEAQQANWYTVAFNHDPDAQADFYIDNFHELVDLLDRAPPMRIAG